MLWVVWFLLQETESLENPDQQSENEKHLSGIKNLHAFELFSQRRYEESLKILSELHTGEWLCSELLTSYKSWVWNSILWVQVESYKFWVKSHCDQWVSWIVIGHLSPDPGDCTYTIDKRSEVAVKQWFIHKTQNDKMKAQKNHSTEKQRMHIIKQRMLSEGCQHKLKSSLQQQIRIVDLSHDL